ncbi:MAG: STAS domain-containing protein [Cyanothece sp. SIO1E1]|nr:STAS domain-containing protein [Cyanothece sp. SIO1E1]
MSDNIRTLEPAGVLDGKQANELRSEVIDILKEGADIILIDLKNVTFMNSSGIGALVSTLKSVRAAKSQLLLCSLSDQVKTIFQLTKMDRVFQSLANRDEFEQKFPSASKSLS